MKLIKTRSGIFHKNIARKSISTLMLIVLVSFSLQFAITTAANASGNTYTVNTLASGVTNSDSTHGSFAWAVQQANASPGHDTIEFHIASEDLNQNGTATIYVDSTINIETPVTIDGRSQNDTTNCNDFRPITIQNTVGTGRTINVNNGTDAGTEHSVISGITYQSYGDNWLNINGDNVELFCDYFNLGADGANPTAGNQPVGLGLYGDNIQLGRADLLGYNYFGGSLNFNNSFAKNLKVEKNVFGFSVNFEHYYWPMYIGTGETVFDGLYLTNNIAQGIYLKGGPVNKNVTLYGNLICVTPGYFDNNCNNNSGSENVAIDSVENLIIGASAGGTNNYINSGSQQCALDVKNVSGTSSIKNNFLGMNAGDQLYGDGIKRIGICYVGTEGATSEIQGNRISGTSMELGVSAYNIGIVNVSGNTINQKSDDAGGEIFGAVKNGIIIESNSSTGGSATETTVYGNKINSPSETGIQFSELNRSGLDTINLYYNTIPNAGIDGIDINLGSTGITGGINSNTITNAGTYGIKQIGTSVISSDIDHNTVTGAGATGIVSSSGKVFSNTVSGSGAYGIYYEGVGDIYSNDVSGSALEGINATENGDSSFYYNNSHDNTGDGYKIVSANDSLIFNNNTSTGNGGNGVNVSGANLSVFSNTINNNVGKGLYYRGHGDNHSNDIDHNGGDGVTAITDGQTAFHGMNVHDNGDAGIRVTANQATTISDNNIYDNYAAGIAFDLSENLSMFKNIMYGNQFGIAFEGNNTGPQAAPKVRSATESNGNTNIAFTTSELVPGDYRIDICYNPDAENQCKVWKDNFQINVTSQIHSHEAEIVGTGYDVNKFTIQATLIVNTQNVNSTSFGIYEELPPPPPPPPATADLSNVVHADSVSGSVTKVGNGQVFGLLGARIYSEICNNDVAVITSFKISKVVSGTSNATYVLHQDSAGSINSNGLWTGTLNQGGCLFIDYYFTVNGAVGTNLSWAATISDLKDGNGDAIDDVQASNNSSTFSVPISNLPDIKVNSRLLTTGPIIANTPVSYAITIQNIGAGPSLGNGLGISFLLPAGATFDSVVLDPDREPDGITLVGCQSLGQADQVGSPGLVNYHGEIMQCSFDVPDAFASGQILPMTFNMTSSTTFETGNSRAIAVAMAWDEEDTIKFISTFSTGGDGFGLLNEDGTHINNISWLDYNADPLTVTINRCAGVGEVTEIDDACFSIVFNKQIYAPSFTVDDLVLTGGGSVYSFVQVSDTEWTVRISGMTHGGTLTLSLDNGSVVDYSAIPNTQVLGENIIRFGAVASGDVDSSGNSNGAAQAVTKTANGALANTGSNYDWYSPLIIILFGWALLLVANSIKKHRSA